MLDPEQEFEYEQKCEQIAMQIEMFVLDRIIAALERLNYNLDVMMPEQGGAIMYRDLKSDLVLKQIPVIILSAVSRSAFAHYLKMLALKSAGKVPAPEAFVEKPPDPRNLLQIIRRFV